MQQPGREEGCDEHSGGLHYEQLNLFNTPFRSLPLEGDMLIVPSLVYRTICIILHSQQYFLNKQCSNFLLIIAFLSYTYNHL